MKLFIDFILVTGIALTASILFLLLNAKSNPLPKKILFVFYFFILFVNLHAYACLHNLVLLYKVSYFFDFVIFWLLGPLLILYVKSHFETPRHLFKSSYKHFILCAFFTISIGIPLVFTLFLEGFQPAYLNYLDENQFLIIIFRDGYFLYHVRRALDALGHYKAGLSLNYSNLSGKDMRWINDLLYGCTVFIWIDIVTRFLDLSSIDFYFDIGYFSMFSIILVTLYTGYHGIRQSRMLLPNFPIVRQTVNQPKTNSLSNHSPSEINSLIHKLETLICQNKLYLDPDLRLDSLSKQVGISNKKLSALLNSYMHISFYDYINSFRVAAVKSTLLSDRYHTLTVLGIALESGFNSKASFNRIFKKETGLSPSQFVHKNRGLKASFETIDIDL